VSVDLELLSILKDRESMDKYSRFIKPNAMSLAGDHVMKAMQIYLKTNQAVSTIVWKDFKIWYKVIHKSGNKKLDEQGEQLLDNIDSYVVTTAVDDIVNKCIKLAYTGEIVELIMKSDGEPDMTAIRDLCDAFQDEVGSAKNQSMEVELNWDDILSSALRINGYTWRLDDLNSSIGKVDGGDLIVLAARPEAGKTSFALSEATHFASQMAPDRDVVIFNNEEGGEKVLSRAMQVTLDKDIITLAKQRDKSLAEYTKALGRKDRIRLVHNTALHTRDVERVLRHRDAGVIIFNTLPKMKGYDKAGNEVSRQEELFRWARDLASRKNAVVIAIMQADGSAENQRYLNMAQLYGSKTAVQGEADVLLLIGCETGNDVDRYISIAKNKLPGDDKTDPKLKHGHFEVEFKPQTGRYKSKYTGGGYP